MVRLKVINQNGVKHMSTPKMALNCYSLENRAQRPTGRSLRQALLGIVTALLSTAAITAHALGIGSCDPSRDVCVNVITDESVPKHTQVQSDISYDINRTHSQLSEEYDWVNPNKAYSAVNLPVNLLISARIKNLAYTITQINQQPQEDCKGALALGLKGVPASVTLKLSYDPHTNLFLCEKLP
jgi:hypothetical protein